ncbi:hypothetical protein STVIR_4693 [Streptomyces viridochromogenes Tue57]|uniref:Uncharacterized protein n=1 Tax=Streptomyces viridochromogenes Tue57 TaxID=1160705 RepID=L8PFS9_STRVR|nr:hypothetical protein STVIR_4693 [Streptomyces viridochromogenes Tue57]
MWSSGCIGFGQADARRIIRPRLMGRPPVSPIRHRGRHGGCPVVQSSGRPRLLCGGGHRAPYPAKFGTIYPVGVCEAVYVWRTR